MDSTIEGQKMSSFQNWFVYLFSNWIIQNKIPFTIFWKNCSKFIVGFGEQDTRINRDVTGRWAGWEIAHPVFGRMEASSGSGGAPHYYLPSPFLGSQLRPWINVNFLTCAAITLWRSAIKLHLQQVQSRNWQCLLWPLSQEIRPWFRHRAHFGLLPDGSFGSSKSKSVGLLAWVAGFEPGILFADVFILGLFATKCDSFLGLANSLSRRVFRNVGVWRKKYPWDAKAK